METAAGSNGFGAQAQTGTAKVKRGMAEMLKGGVIMDVVTPSRHASRKARAPSRSWLSNVSRQTFARKAASPG